MIMIDADEVAARLDHRTCIRLMREAMIALAQGRTDQLLRGMLDLGHGNMLGVMPGSLDGAGFGAKLVSIFPDAPGGRSHQGLIVLFDAASGAPAAAIEAGEVTAIRTACASAAATDALARADAVRLAILGTGEQAWQHVAAIRHVRPLEAVTIWGRDRDKADRLAARVASELRLPARAAADPGAAVAEADIVCTTTAAVDPILRSADVRDGTHLNVVGSGHLGPVEIDAPLVARARFVPDHRAGVLAQGSEVARARDLGLIENDHVLPEIGHVFAGTASGRLSRQDVTVYKSLGSIAQDLACAAFLVSGRERSAG